MNSSSAMTPPPPVSPPPSGEAQAFGAWLRQEREKRFLTLDMVARETRVQRRYLEALEKGRFDLLPGEVFARGFVRSYAQSLGAPPEEWLGRYLESRGMAPPPAEAAAPPRSRTEPEPAASEESANQARMAALAFALLVILGLAGIGWALRRSLHPAPAAPVTEAPAAAPTEVSSRMFAGPESMLAITMSADADVYVEHGAGSVLLNRRMRRGEKRAYPAGAGLLVRVNPAGAAELRLDGRLLAVPEDAEDASWTLRLRSAAAEPPPSPAVPPQEKPGP